MVGTSSSSSSSCASFGSFDDIPIKACTAVKFLCSYGGRILPRYLDGKLRYIGVETRVLSIDRSVPFSVLLAKLGEMCGWVTVNLRCQLPTEDLDALFSVTSNEDLANLIEEYDLASRNRQSPLKIRAFLHPTPMKSPKSVTPAGTISRVAAAARGKAPFRHPLRQKTKYYVCSGRSSGHQINGRRNSVLFTTAIIGNNLIWLRNKQLKDADMNDCIVIWNLYLT